MTDIVVMVMVLKATFNNISVNCGGLLIYNYHIKYLKNKEQVRLSKFSIK
jgi:hypothetical protein